MSAFSIHVLIETELPGDLQEEAARSHVRRAAAATLGRENAPAASTLSILLAGDDHVRRLNRDYREVDKPTDVLSFPAEPDTPPMAHYLGDVIIAVPVAVHQATAAGHSFVDELYLLVVHGVLHLLGHDHMDAAEKERMWAVQDAVLADMGLALRSPSVEEIEEGA